MPLFSRNSLGQGMGGKMWIHLVNHSAEKRETKPGFYGFNQLEKCEQVSWDDDIPN